MRRRRIWAGFQRAASAVNPFPKRRRTAPSSVSPRARRSRCRARTRLSSTRTTEMGSSDGFPRELLLQPPEVRLASFARKVVAHPRLSAAHHTLLQAIRDPARASLILVVGPTGVGKTTLRRGIERHLVAEALPDLATDPGRLPVVAVEAAAPESGQFHWKDYYTRALIALNEPLVDRKIDYAVRGFRRDREGTVVVEHTTSAPELRRALEQGLRPPPPSAVIHYG